MLTIDKFSRIPIYEQVIAQMEMHILLEDFPLEEPLPSVRSLSVSLGVNPNTMQKAYMELERRGLCQSAPGSGRFVTKDAKQLLKQRSRERLNDFKELVLELNRAGVQRQELIRAIDEALDLHPGEGDAQGADPVGGQP